MLTGRGRLNRDMTFFLLTAVLGPVSLLLGLAGGLPETMEAALTLPTLGMAAAMSAAAWCVGALLSLLLQRFTRPRAQRNLLAAVLFPLFMLSWMPLQVLALFHRTTVWKPIRHGGQAERVL